MGLTESSVPLIQFSQLLKQHLDLQEEGEGANQIGLEMSPQASLSPDTSHFP